MNLVIAGLDILFWIMKADNRLEDSEVREMMHFLVHGMQETRKPLFPSRPNLTDVMIEIGLLSALDPAELQKRMRNAGSYFRDHATDDQKKKLLSFADEIVRADGRVLPEEENALLELGKLLADRETTPAFK